MKRNGKLTVLSVSMLVVLFVSSCKKQIDARDSVIQVSNKVTKDFIPVYPFTWESVDFMTTPVANTILVPWASGANQQYDATDMAFDMKAADGWQLVYNTFNSTALTNPQFFALYNVYRGLYRMYFYLPPTTPTPSNYLQEALSLTGGGNSSLLNFNGQDIIDVNTNLTTVTTIAPYQVVASGGWYVLQFEMAYDPNIKTVNYSSLQTIWSLSSVNVTQNTLDGTQNGTLTGTITTPSTFSFAGAALTGVLDAAGLGAVSALSGIIPAAIASAAQSGISMSLSGQVKNVFNAIIGGNSATTQQVNLALNTTISLTGTSTENFGLASPTLIIPGTLWDPSTTTAGYVPNYNQTLGVFNITARPTITEHKTTIHNGPPPFGLNNTFTQIDYTLDNSSYAVIFNTDALNGLATIQNITKEIILLTPSVNSDLGNGPDETVGNWKAYVTNQLVLPFGQFGPIKAAVRISFDVVPTNGTTPTSRIVKTFLANLTTI
jgi:hypothetical protein